jgi:hypothetical protein
VRPAAGQSRRRAAAAVQGGGARWRDPNLGFPATDGDAEGTYTTRATRRTDLGRRLGRRRGGAGGRRGGAGRELRRGHRGRRKARGRHGRHRHEAHLLAQLWTCSSTVQRRRRRGSKAAARVRVSAALVAAAHGQGGSGEGRPGGGAAYKGPGGLLGVRATRGRRAPAGLGRRRRWSPRRGRVLWNG